MKSLFLVPFLLCAALNSAAAGSPNVVVILTDDQGWGDLSLNGNTNLNTPNIDSLARDGAAFERFFVCPVCSPTRAEFLTGRYHPRGGVYSTSAGGERLDLDETTIADAFREAGYATGAFGKWHNGMQFPYHPNGRGFDEFYGFCSGHWGNYFDAMLERNGEIEFGEGFIIDDFTNKAMEWIEGSVADEKPFFCYLPYNTPHSPMQVPNEFWDRFKDKPLAMHNRDPKKEIDLHLRCALAMCENIDWNVGRLLEKLDKLGVAEDTIVVFFHDNGPNGTRWNGDMKGRKGSTDEGGVRSPLLVRWPGKISGGKRVEKIGAAIDLLPTLASMAGVEKTGPNPLDGISLAPWLVDGDGDEPELGDRRIFSHWRGKVSVRTQEFRLDHQGALFHLDEDPGQRMDVSKKHLNLTQQLLAEVEAWKAELLPGYDDDQRPFVIGHPGSEFTQVPARDGIATGEIKRSNKFPNDSYFGNWKNLKDQISWRAQVGGAGTYEVQIFYACGADAIGTKLELSFGESRLTGEITAANDVPEIGHAEDRHKRAESYVKTWKPMTLGRIKLDEGDGELVLRALKKPGAEVMDFRLMMLRRIES
ncbi:MAG: arylsulfatase A-like enzyme [Verrucomicrobiales bacterium]|jgi:arylsulfatase A-like enzyme